MLISKCDTFNDSGVNTNIMEVTPISLECKKSEKEFNIDPYSTWLHPGTREFEQVKQWIITSLGYPSTTIEITDSQLCVAIGNALRIFTKYKYYPPKYLVLDLFHYKHGTHPNDVNAGLDLTPFKVMSVREIGYQRDNMMGYGMDMFFSPYSYMGQGAVGPFFGMGNGNAVGSFVTYQCMNEWFDMVKRMCGSNPDFQYDKTSRKLHLMPEPQCAGKSHRFIVATCFVEPPLETLLGEDYFLRLALAESKIIVGMVRKKFSGTQLLGGGQIDTEIFNEGKEERDKLIEEIQKCEGIGQSFFLS